MLSAKQVATRNAKSGIQTQHCGPCRDCGFGPAFARTRTTLDLTPKRFVIGQPGGISDSQPSPSVPAHPHNPSDCRHPAPDRRKPTPVPHSYRDNNRAERVKPVNSARATARTTLSQDRNAQNAPTHGVDRRSRRDRGQFGASRGNKITGRNNPVSIGTWTFAKYTGNRPPTKKVAERRSRHKTKLPNGNRNNTNAQPHSQNVDRLVEAGSALFSGIRTTTAASGRNKVARLASEPASVKKQIRCRIAGLNRFENFTNTNPARNSSVDFARTTRIIAVPFVPRESSSPVLAGRHRKAHSSKDRERRRPPLSRNH